MISFKTLLDLTRYKVSIAVTFSGLAASVAFVHGFTLGQILPMVSIFLLASGASALNQLQESSFDAKMERTSSRPIPSNQIPQIYALIISCFLVTSGLLILVFISAWMTLLLGIFNILWYNGLYTPLKRITAFAVVPGALTGAIPIFMGWTAVGGSLTELFPLMLGFFIFIWQVPHFWLLGMMYEDDYKKAGFPVITDLFNNESLKRMIYTWLFASTASSFLIILFGNISSLLIKGLVIFLNILLILTSTYLIFFKQPFPVKRLFILVNMFMLLVFLLIIFEHIHWV